MGTGETLSACGLCLWFGGGPAKPTPVFLDGLWSMAVFPENYGSIVGPSAHPMLQKVGDMEPALKVHLNHLRKSKWMGPPRIVWRWMKRRLRPALQDHSEPKQ